MFRIKSLQIGTLKDGSEDRRLKGRGKAERSSKPEFWRHYSWMEACLHIPKKEFMCCLLSLSTNLPFYLGHIVKFYYYHCYYHQLNVNILNKNSMSYSGAQMKCN